MHALAVQDGADPVAMPGEDAREQRDEIHGQRALAHFAGAEVHRARQVEQEPGGDLPVLVIFPHVGRVEARGHVPVDMANVVPVLVFPQVGEIQALAAKQRAVIALQQAVEAAQHRPLDAPQDGFRIRCQL
jgi:hypothetical protein